MKVMICLAFFVACLPLTPKERLSRNGTYWKTLTAESKWIFVDAYTNGYSDGAGLVLAVANEKGLPPSRLKSAYSLGELDGLSLDQLTDGVNQCFKDFRNEKIQIGDCIRWSAQGIRGVSDESRTRFLETARKLADRTN